MKIPMEWLAGKRILTAEQVRKMEPGTEVFRHQCYGRRGEHVWCKCTVVQNGTKKKLKMYDGYGLPEYKDIKAAENVAYTED